MSNPPVISINDELVAELEQLANKATPGPWEHIQGDQEAVWSEQFPRVSAADEDVIGNEGFYSEKDRDEANAAFIAKANPATILALLQHVRELKMDAERYQFLRSCPHAVADGLIDVCVWADDSGSALRDFALDEAIDSARSSATR